MISNAVNYCLIVVLFLYGDYLNISTGPLSNSVHQMVFFVTG